MAESKKNPISCCEYCTYYEYDDEMGTYSCVINLDEDEMAAFLLNRRRECPYFRFSDDYKLAHKQ